jgi:DNA polymerase III delta prime subunit
MVLDCNDPENKDNPVCTPNQPSLFDCTDPTNKEAKECKITNATESDLTNIEDSDNKKICDSLDGNYNQEDKICVIPSKNYLSIEMDKFDDVLGKKYTGIITQLKSEIANDSIANFLFEGPPGLGKSQIARLLPKEYARTKGFSTEDFLKYNVKQISGSEKLGVDFIRDSLDKFIKTRPFLGEQKFLIIDEAERLSPEAQAQLKTVITDVIPRSHSKIAIILTTNKLEKLDPTLASSGRFHTEEFGLLDENDMMSVMENIQERNSIAIPIESQSEVIEKSAGSVRNLLENMYRVAEGNSPYDYSTHESIVALRKNKVSAEKAKLEVMDMEIQNKILAEQIAARKFAIEHLGEYTNDEILDSLMNSAGVPPELQKEYTKNLAGLRELYALQNHTTISNIDKVLQQRQKETEKRKEAQTKQIKEKTEKAKEEANKIPVQLPAEINFMYRGKPEEVNIGNEGGKEILTLWAITQTYEKTQNPAVLEDMYKYRNHLIFDKGFSRDYVKNVIREARKNYTGGNNDGNDEEP